MPEAVIVATARTPIGRANKGSLTECRPDDLAGLHHQGRARQGARSSTRRLVEDVIMGCGQPGGEAGYNVARVAALLAGLPDVPGVTVNRYCSSSLQTIRMAAHAIKAGEGDVFVAAGVETVSRYMHGAVRHRSPQPALRRRRGPHGRAHRRAPAAGTPPAGLPDIYIAMGQTAENVVLAEGVTREEMDEWGARSQQRAVAAQERGFFDREITPVTLRRRHRRVEGRRPPRRHHRREAGRAEAGVPSRRQGHRRQRLPAERRRRRRRRDERHQGERARHHAAGPHRRPRGVTGLNPEIMGMGPVEACRQALGRAGLTIDDIDLVEINEAFAAQVLPSMKHLGIDPEKLNVNGGAIALGHPFGMTGARIMTTLINGLEDTGGRYGLESMCVGGGQGMAMVIERLS